MDLKLVEAELAKMLAETAKINAEGEKLRREARWMPWVASSVFLGAVLALAKLFAEWFKQ